MIKSTRPAITAKTIGLSDLIGVWRLESFITKVATMEPVYPLGHKPQGLLIYTADAFVSVQMMRRGRTAISSDAWRIGVESESEKVAGGYIGYCGTYLFDEGAATVCHMPEIALAPNLIGEQLARSVSLDQELLTLTVVNSQEEGASVETSLRWRKLDRDAEKSPLSSITPGSPATGCQPTMCFASRNLRNQ